MIQSFFNINFELDKATALSEIDKAVEKGATGYVCVVDGVVLNHANRYPEYMRSVNGAMFSICDSGYIPLYLKWIYGMKVKQYCGFDIFQDIIQMKKYRMAFLGGSHNLHISLKENLKKIDKRIDSMKFKELPYMPVDKFDYKGIADQLNNYGADIIWVSLGAPKQEEFMSRLKPYLKHGIAISVGAVFKFYSGTKEKRAPKWMLNNHLEFVYRIFCSPRKQINRCYWIVRTLPGLLIGEIMRKRKNNKQI